MSVILVANLLTALAQTLSTMCALSSDAYVGPEDLLLRFPSTPCAQEPACARTSPRFHGTFPDTVFFWQRTGVSWFGCTKGNHSGMQDNIYCVWHGMECPILLLRRYHHKACALY